MASRTAFGEPGSTKIALRDTVPAVARLIIADAPISPKLSIRKSSPKPSSRFSSSWSIASNVPSRDVMPVPPVVMITCVRESPTCSRTLAATCAGSSLDDGVAGDEVTGAFEQIADGAAAGIGVGRARVAHGQHEAGNRGWRLRLVLDVAHERDYID